MNHNIDAQVKKVNALGTFKNLVTAITEDGYVPTLTTYEDDSEEEVEAKRVVVGALKAAGHPVYEGRTVSTPED